jgi:hypothetical protein
MGVFVDHPMVQAHRTDTKGCAKLWELECKRANLPPCPFNDALSAWTAMEKRRAGDIKVSLPDLEGLVQITMSTGNGDVVSVMPARTLFRMALKAYAQTFVDPVRFLEDLRLLSVPHARTLHPPKP